MSEKIFTQVGFRVEIEEVFHPDGRVLVFHVPPRPRSTAYHLDGSYLMRSGENLVPMSEDHLRKIFAEGAEEWLEEPSHQGLTSDEVVGLLDTPAFFNLLQLNYPDDRRGVLDRLTALRLVDMSNGKYAIRRLGGLLLAKDLSQFPDLSSKAPRVIVYSGKSKVLTKLDKLASKGYAVGFSGLIGFIMGQLPQNEVIEGALRREVKLVSELSIRELVANALIHQDFSIRGMSPVVEVYSNRVEISNPGEPIVPVERFIDGYQSRNERLADLMRQMRICEEKSSGIDKVIQEAELLQLPAPDFQTHQKRTIAIIYGPKSFDDMDKAERIRACYQHCVLKWVMRELMTNQSLRERFHLPESKIATVSQIIAAAVDSGSIKPRKKVGMSKKFAQYEPVWA